MGNPLLFSRHWLGTRWGIGLDDIRSSWAVILERVSSGSHSDPDSSPASFERFRYPIGTKGDEIIGPCLSPIIDMWSLPNSRDHYRYHRRPSHFELYLSYPLLVVTVSLGATRLDSSLEPSFAEPQSSGKSWLVYSGNTIKSPATSARSRGRKVLGGSQPV